MDESPPKSRFRHCEPRWLVFGDGAKQSQYTYLLIFSEIASVVPPSQ